MLKYLKVKNVLSFKEETEINFESSNRGKKKDNIFSIKAQGKTNTFAKSMVIFGANASGKTNLLRVMRFIRKIAVSANEKGALVIPFLLDVNTPKQPSFFEIGFFIDKKEYIFNFEILNRKILSENLIEVKKDKNIYLYKRKGQKIKSHESFKKEAEKGLGKAREEVSFFAVLTKWNGKLNKKPIDYFFRNMNILFGNDVGHSLTVNLLDLVKSDQNKKIIIEFLKCADIDIEDLRIYKKAVPSEMLKMFSSEFIKETDQEKEVLVVETGHKIKGSKEIKYFNLGEESAGTRRLFSVLGPIIDSILNERILFIDEIEANLHPHILKNIFNLIHSKIDKKYQFIFTTHSPTLMDLNIFKKEQIGIVEKNKENATEFYTLFDFEDLRNETNLKKLYNLGSLGGVPLVSDFSNLIAEIDLWGENPRKS